MRIRNKELRQRWHRKEQRVKELVAEAKKNKAEAGPKPKAAKPVAEKKAAEKKPVAKKPKAETADAVAEKPKRATKKKTEEAAG